MKLPSLLFSHRRSPLLLPGLLGLLFAGASPLLAQSTAFGYQGRLQDGGSAPTGLYDFEFRLFNAASGGTQQGPTVTLNDLGVTNGIFNAALDFGANFPGADRFLQLSVRPGASIGAYTNLNPRQPITATPYAIRSLEAAGLPAGAVSGAMLADGAVTATKLAPGALTGNGANLTNVNATTLGGVGSAGFWKTNGNAGAAGGFLGTTDNQPLEFRANNTRVLRIEPNPISPNLVGGTPGNLISNGVVGGFIGGGGEGASPNRVGGDFASVLGGIGNTASGDLATAMGFLTTASGNAALAMGYDTRASGNNSTAFGYGTTASGAYATALGNFSQALHAGSLVWADSSSSTPFASTANNQFLLRATGGVGINTNNPQGAALAVNGSQFINGGYLGVGTFNPFTLVHAKSVSGDAEISIESGDEGAHRWTLQSSGTNSSVMLDRSFQIIDRSLARPSLVLGYQGNVALGPFAMAGNDYSTAIGYNTTASGYASTAIGINATASGIFSTALGYNTLAGGYATAMGYRARATHSGAFVWADRASIIDFSSITEDEFAIRATGGFRLSDNSSQYFGAATRQMLNLWGTNYGIGVQASSLYFRCNNSGANDGFIWYLGGAHNDAYANAGGGNELMHLTNAGLDVNGEIHWGTASSLSINQEGSIELGSSTSSATTPFLDFHYGVAANQDYNTRIINSGDQQLDIVRIGSPTPMAQFKSSGLTVNGTFVSTSDRNAKENFEPVDAQEVLNKVAALPLTRWNYKEDRTQRHLGPMAQDFQAAFGVGPDDKHIATVDADGVALAAIQGLNRKVDAQRAELQSKDARIAELEQRLAAIEALLKK